MDAWWAILIFFAVSVIVVLVWNWLREKPEPLLQTSHLFNDDGSIKWPEGLHDELAAREEQTIADSMLLKHPEVAVMRATWASEDDPKTPKWVDGGVSIKTVPAVWHESGPNEYRILDSEPDEGFKIHKLECDNCGASLKVEPGSRIALCPHCGGTYYLENFEPDADPWPPPSTMSYFLADSFQRRPPSRPPDLGRRIRS